MVASFFIEFMTEKKLDDEYVKANKLSSFHLP